MLYYIESFLIIIFEVFCCKIFYETFGDKRIHKIYINLIQMFLMCLFFCLLTYVLWPHFLVRQLVYILIFPLIMYWYIKISYRKSLVLFLLYQGLMLLTDYITLFIISYLFAENGVLPEDHIAEGHLITLLGKVILFLFILIIRKYFRKKDAEMLTDSEWLRFLAFPVFTIVMIIVMLYAVGFGGTSVQSNVLFAFAIGMAGINIAVFYLINDILKREMTIYENKMFQLQVKNQTAMYRSISENFDNQKKKTHEYKNQIICIESLLGKKQYDELEKYVKTIYGELNQELDLINTNNVIVNAILNTKYQEMTEKNILFVFRVNDLSDLGISDEDIVIVLSNLLNNAIEACEQCEDKRIIKLKFVKEEKIIIAVRNSFQHALHYENGEIQSTKILKPEEHGIGIKNIKRVLDKYGGSYVIQEQGNEFYFSIVIPCPFSVIN